MFYREKSLEETLLGKMPKSWSTFSLEELGLMQDGDWILKEDYAETGVRLLQVGDVGQGSFIDKSNRYVSFGRAKELNCTFVKPGEDILISRMPDPVGRACVAPILPYQYIVAVDITIFRINKEVADLSFVTYVLNSSKTLREASRFSSGATRVRISRTNLEKIRIILPPICEQQALARILSCVDLAIQKTDEVIAKTERLKKGLTQKLLTEGIGHKEFNDTEIGRIPRSWHVTRFGSIATRVQNGLYKEKRYYGSGYALVRMTEFFRNDALVIGDDIRFVQANQDELDKFSLEEGDLLFARTSLKAEGSGRCVFVPRISKPTLFESNIIRVSLDTAQVFPKFYFYWLNSSLGRKQVSRVIRTVAASIVTGNDLKRVIVPLPPELHEQEEISKILSTVDDKITIEKEEKAKLERIKKGLMNLLLTGKVRVRVD